MAEAALEPERQKPGRKPGFLDETRFKRTYYINGAFQRVNEQSKREANEAWQKCHEAADSQDELAFMLEFCALNSGKAAGLHSLVNGSKSAWTIYNT